MYLELNNDEIWHKFIYVAFEKSDFFSLTNYDWSDDTALNYSYNRLNEQLAEHKIDKSYCLPNGVWGEYSLSYYECNFHSMSVIQEIPNIFEMVFPKFPENISFYKNDKMWFGSITHDYYWDITDPDIYAELRSKF